MSFRSAPCIKHFNSCGGRQVAPLASSVARFYETLAAPSACQSTHHVQCARLVVSFGNNSRFRRRRCLTGIGCIGTPISLAQATVLGPRPPTRAAGFGLITSEWSGVLTRPVARAFG